MFCLGNIFNTVIDFKWSWACKVLLLNAFFLFLWGAISILQHLPLRKPEHSPHLRAGTQPGKPFCVLVANYSELLRSIKIALFEIQIFLTFSPPPTPPPMTQTWVLSRLDSFLSCFSSHSLRRCSFTSSKICIPISCQFSSWNIHAAICSES